MGNRSVCRFGASLLSCKEGTRKGFTLIELLAVIGIIGLLAGIILVALGGARGSARDAVRAAETQTIQRVLEVYLIANTDFQAIVLASNNESVGGILRARFYSDPAASGEPDYNSWSDLESHFASIAARLPADPVNDIDEDLSYVVDLYEATAPIPACGAGTVDSMYHIMAKLERDNSSLAAYYQYPGLFDCDDFFRTMLYRFSGL